MAKRTGPRSAEYFDITCTVCESPHRSARRDGKFCSDACKGVAYATKCRLSPDHPVMVLITQAKSQRSVKVAPTQHERECAWCGGEFVTTKNVQRFCCFDCKRRAKVNRRRGREHGSTSHFTWAEVMNLFVHTFKQVLCLLRAAHRGTA